MSNDPFKDPIIQRVMIKDRQLRQRIDAAAARGESGEEELYRLYNERYNVLLAAEKMPVHPLMKVIFRDMADHTELETSFLKMRKDFNKQLSQIITKVNNIEDEIKTIREKLNINVC